MMASSEYTSDQIKVKWKWKESCARYQTDICRSQIKQMHTAIECDA